MGGKMNITAKIWLGIGVFVAGFVLAARKSLHRTSSAGRGARPTESARIAELRRQYVNGTYHVDAAKVSAKIIDEHLLST
jgi:hypothetical protein